MENGTTNWGQSVTGVVIKDNKVLLARHTYGGGKGKLIIPGGYLENGETPQDALRREFMEEVGVAVQPGGIIGVRFNAHDWYVVFRAEYVSGVARSDGDENSEVLWVDCQEVQARDDVPELTKLMVRSALRGDGLERIPYDAEKQYSSAYGMK